MLLVDDDQAEGGERGEDRGAGADDDVDVAAADAVPLVVALAVREAAVLHGDPFAEGAAEGRRRGRRQGDLRHEDQRAAPARADVAGKPEVDLRLPAPRDAVQQGDPEPPRLRQRTQRGERPPLVGRRLARRRSSGPRGAGAGADPGLPLHPPRGQRHEPAPLQAPERRRAHAPAGQGGQVDPVGRSRQRGQRVPLPAAECGEAGAHRVAAGRRDRRHAHRLEARAAPGGGRQRPRRQRRGDRLPRPAGVVVRHPERQLQDRRRQERLVVEAGRHVPDRVVPGAFPLRAGGVPDHAAGDDAAAEGHRHPAARGRRRQLVGNAVGQRRQEGDRHRDRHVARHRVSPRGAASGRASCPPRPPACGPGCGGGRPGGTSVSTARPGSCTPCPAPS